MRRILMGCVAAVSVWMSMAAVVPVAVGTGYSSGGYYRYCPATLVEDGVRHVFYCKNKTSYQVVDAIYHAVQSADGTLSNETQVLAPADTTGTAWDSYHVCDPSVIAGAFVYNGHTYKYLMAYLGVKGKAGDGTSDGAKCINNKVGLAVSDNLASGWVRMGANPVVETEHLDWWGVGQPSVISLDGAGQVALFYAGDYETRMLTLDFTDADATVTSLTTQKGSAGKLVGKTGVSDLKCTTTAMTITNGDFAYDADQGYLYLVADTPDAASGWYDAGGQNLYITKAVTVYRAYLPNVSVTTIAAATWEEVARMQPTDLNASTYTSAARVHNAGFVRTPGGALAEPVVNASVANVVSGALYTYRFQSVAFDRGEERYLDFTGQRPMNLRNFMGPKTKIAVDYRMLEIGPLLQQRVIGIKWHHGIYNNGSGNVCFQSCEGLTSTGDKKNTFGKSDSRRHLGVIDVPAQKHVYVTGTTTNTASFTNPTAATTDHPIFLAGASNSADGETFVIPSSAAQCYNAKVRVYGVKIWEDGTLVHDYSPARVDGFDGLLDAVDGVFLPAGKLADAGPNAVLGGYGEIVSQRGAAYLEADGHQKIETDYKVSPRSRLAFDFATTEKQANTRLCNAGRSDRDLYLDFYSSSSYGVTFFTHDSAGSWNATYSLGTQSSTLAMTTNLFVRRTYVVDWKNSSFTLATAGYTNQTSALKTPVPTATAASPVTFLGGGNVNQMSRGRFYGAKIYEDDVLVANYIPAIKDGIACLHDTIGGSFFTGDKVPTGVTGAPLGIGGTYEMSTDAFIESDGTQAINTGYFSTPNSRVEVDFILNETNQQTRVFGVDGSASKAVEVFYIAGSARYAFVNNSSWTGQIDSGVKADRTRHTAVIDRKNDLFVLKTDGTEVYSKAFTTDHNNTSLWPMGLFAGVLNADGTSFSAAERRARMKLFAFRVYENDVLVHEFLPYKNGTVIGLYDTKTGTVKTNVLAGGNPFTIGGAGDFLERPAETTVSVRRSASFKVYAPGAIAYRWMLDGETINDVTTDAATISWRAQNTASTLVVTPVFQLNGRQFEGEPATSTLSFAPLGMLMTIR